MRYIEKKYKKIHGNCSHRRRLYQDALGIGSAYDLMMQLRDREPLEKRRRFNISLANINRAPKISKKYNLGKYIHLKKSLDTIKVLNESKLHRAVTVNKPLFY